MQDDALSKRTVEGSEWHMLSEFALPSEPGNERLAMERVAEAVAALHLSPARLERLKTAVAETALNAIEHGNRYQAELPVTIRVLVSDKALAVHVTDAGSGAIPAPVPPDLEAKLAGRQSPRGWGFFLIEKMVDEMRITRDNTQRTVELLMYLPGEERGSQPT